MAEQTENILEQLAQASGKVQPAPIPMSGADTHAAEIEQQSILSFMQDYLAQDEMVQVFVPSASSLSKNGLNPPLWLVSVQGVTVEGPCDEPVMVAKTIADILNESLRLEKDNLIRQQLMSARSGALIGTYGGRND